MIVYVETNFILELVFHQQQFETCNLLLNLCETGKISLVTPAYSLIEPNEKLVRQASERKELQERLDNEIRQLIRTAPYAARISHLREIGQLLIKSNEENQQRFTEYRKRFLDAVEIITLTKQILQIGADYETSFSLSPQDGIILASIITHLDQNSTGDESCFLNQDIGDFNTSSIVSELAQYNCRMIYRFDHGLSFVQSRLS
ncbi:MAG: PIN domain-containing protein [Candidatus Promineifilaceae bacterium]